MNKTTSKISAGNNVAGNLRNAMGGFRWGALAVALFFVAEWAMLSFYDSSTLARIEQLSAF